MWIPFITTFLAMISDSKRDEEKPPEISKVEIERNYIAIPTPEEMRGDYIGAIRMMGLKTFCKRLAFIVKKSTAEHSPDDFYPRSSYEFSGRERRETGLKLCGLDFAMRQIAIALMDNNWPWPWFLAADDFGFYLVEIPDPNDLDPPDPNIVRFCAYPGYVVWKPGDGTMKYDKQHSIFSGAIPDCSVPGKWQIELYSKSFCFLFNGRQITDPILYREDTDSKYWKHFLDLLIQHDFGVTERPITPHLMDDDDYGYYVLTKGQGDREKARTLDTLWEKRDRATRSIDPSGSEHSTDPSGSKTWEILMARYLQRASGAPGDDSKVVE
jgi:hypothetical protein